MSYKLPFRLLRTIPRSSLLAAIDTLGIELTTNDVVANTRKVLHTTTTNEHDAVFLEVMSLTHDVGLDLVTIGQTHTRNLSQGGVWLLGCHGCHLHTHTTLEGCTFGKGHILHLESIPGVLERRRLTLLALALARLADELINGRHRKCGRRSQNMSEPMQGNDGNEGCKGIWDEILYQCIRGNRTPAAFRMYVRTPLIFLPNCKPRQIMFPMPRIHTLQTGLFHVTTNAKNRSPWCTTSGVPEMLIDNLFTTCRMQKARLDAFCVLPDHMHFLILVDEPGLSRFMHSFKRNSSKDVRHLLGSRTTTPECSRETLPECSRDSAIPAVRSCISTHPVAGVTEPRLRCGMEHEINVIMNTDEEWLPIFTGWQSGYYDEHITSDRQRNRAYEYILKNPVHHHLVTEIDDWPWSSMRFAEEVDLLGMRFDRR